MQDKLYAADHHFFHRGVLDWCSDTRPFDNLRDMHDAIIEAHNARAERSTDVYFLGDFAGPCDDKELEKVFNAMKGRKHLVIGNHDNRAVLRLRWSSQVKPWNTVKDGDRRIFLCHYAIHSWPGMYNGHYHFYGHTHGKLPSHGRSIDVGLDSWQLAPRTADEIIARMAEWNPDFDSYTPERRKVILSADDNAPEAEAYEPELRNAPGYGGYCA